MGSKVIVLIDSCSTHNFIDKKVAEIFTYFAYCIKHLQVMIGNSSSIKCEGKCHNMKLAMEKYTLGL